MSYISLVAFITDTQSLFTLDALADTVMAITFLIIPAGIIYFVRKKEDLAFRWTFILFSILLLLCGFNFATEILHSWKSYYWFDVTLKTITALVAVITTVLLYPLLNRLMNLPSHQQLAEINTLLEIQLLKQKEVEEKLTEREKQLLKAQKIAKLGLTEWDLITGEAKMSEELYEIYGFNPKNPPTLTELNAIIHPDDLDRVNQTIKETFNDINPYSYSFRIITRKGDVKVIFVQGETVFDSNRTPLKRISILQDITQIRNLENELGEAQEKFKHAFDFAPIGIALVSPEGNFVKVNRSFCKMLGYDEEELLLCRIHDITHPKDMKKDAELMEQVHSGDLYISQREKRFKHKNGNNIDVLINISLVRNKNGLPLYDVMQVLNITQKKQAENELKEIHKELRKVNDELEIRIKERTEELEVINKELEAFSYSVSHDLKTPLRGIDGFSQILFEDYYDTLDIPGRRMLQKIRTNSQKMSELIDSLLKLAQLSKHEMELTNVDLTLIANISVEELQLISSEKKVIFNIAEDIQAYGDKNLLTIVINNLIGNAWKFSSKNDFPVVQFGKVRELKDTFFIKDNGTGFDMRYAEKIFSPFQRLHKDTEYQGTGVGLATVQKIVQRHGGEIWAESKIGEGSTFYFTLPDS